MIHAAKKWLAERAARALEPIEIPGIDVSRWQGRIDWPKVKAAGYRFAIVKVSEGADLVDPEADRNIKGAQDAGLDVSGYHFGTWFNMKGNPIGDARAEAANYCEQADRMGIGDVRPWLDIEWDGKGRGKDTSAADRIAWASEWLDLADEFTGSGSAGIYTGANFWRYMMANTPELSSRPLWLARYSGPPKEYKLPGVWRAQIGLEQTQVPSWRTIIWQRTGKGKVPGVPARCDINLFRGTWAEYQGLWA